MIEAKAIEYMDRAEALKGSVAACEWPQAGQRQRWLVQARRSSVATTARPPEHAAGEGRGVGGGRGAHSARRRRYYHRDRRQATWTLLG